ncbi:MAG: hypothetical protein INQ03_04695 [Candidatus Heimdallarchaeota archaeon]|nr:hypothetical protein [Candidatus Heimdallarchaeota archaeon]
MTTIAHHLRCDSRKVCSQCSIYLWKPNPKEPKFYFYCPSCKHDILCDRGLITSFEYDDSMMAEKARHLCLICRNEVEDRQWPEPTGKRLDMIS